LESAHVISPATQDTSPAETIAGLARRRARENADGLAFAFLADGASESGRLTFGELDSQASRIARHLHGISKPGDRALLVYEAGIDFMPALLGCFYAGLIAVPIPAPEASRLQASLPRLKAVAADCEARLLLGNPRTHELLGDHRSILPAIAGDCWIDTRQVAADEALDGGLAEFAKEEIAYLQYTSGSTATPKGVVLLHANVMAHLAAIQEALGYDSSSVSVVWMPHFHDYGLVEGLLIALYNGTPAYILSPFSFLKRPLCWLEAISKYRGTHTQGPNFAYRHCVRRIRPDQTAGLDLSCVRSMGNGAEPIHPDTSREFHELFGPCGLSIEALRPAYGLAEATLIVTATAAGSEPVVPAFDAAALVRGRAVAARPGTIEILRIAGCGVPLPKTEVAIVDPESGRRLALGEIGEVWVSSPAVCAGYWNRPSESEATFRAPIAGESGGTYLRTGDLGFLHEGQLYITARLKDLIIVRGQNLYPQDIEWTAQRAHPALREDNGAAFGLVAGGEERLAMVQEVERAEYSADELDKICEAMAAAVAEQFGVSLYAAALIRRASIPKTSSGKIQRSVCRQGFLDGSLKPVHVWRSPAALDWVPGADSQVTRSRKASSDLIAWLRDYGERRINSRLIDERRCVPPPVVLDFGNRGLFGLQTPAEYGGLALRNADTVRVYEQLGALDLTLAMMVLLHNTNGIRPILGYATEETRRELLPALATGRELSAFALSEPGAGSNLGAVEARAVPDGEDAWRISGVKRWNASAWAGTISVFARMVDTQGRLRGLTGFAVRQSDPGVEIGPESLTFGMRGIMQNSVRFDNVRVTRDRMLGQPGYGMHVVEDVLAHGRFFIAAVSIGAMRRCAQLILRYASRRQIDTGLLLDNPQIAAKVSELVHRIGAASALVSHVADRMDAGRPLMPEAAMALKVSATDSLCFGADLLMQILGGRGYMENNLAPQLFRDARLLTIGEGANESLAAAMGRSARLSEPIYEFLGELPGGAEFASRLRSLSQLAPAASEETWRTWFDARLGRLSIAAIQAAAPVASGTKAYRQWALQEWEALSTEVERSAPLPSFLLTGEEIGSSVCSYRDAIGDLEPKSPDVDYELDPLLRRDVAEDAPDAERKRRLLRILLEASKTKNRGERE
jgi:acyl-CoA synthetase (AMP-forming)/AMP-acid ligase II/alkylation response protein AidB-like acyl-CoA dehydrogenase